MGCIVLIRNSIPRCEVGILIPWFDVHRRFEYFPSITQFNKNSRNILYQQQCGLLFQKMGQVKCFHPMDYDLDELNLKLKPKYLKSTQNFPSYLLLDS